MIQDLMTIGVLVILEGVLSIDNALVLAVMARSVPKRQQKKVLTYGLIGALVLRAGAVFAAQSLLKSPIVKILGALYLLFLTFRHFTGGEDHDKKTRLAGNRGFWTTVLMVELTDLAFAVDSILAAVAMTPKYWVVITGGVMGTVMMRYAATLMIRLLDKYPRLEDTAYVLVAIIGLKLGLEATGLPWVDFHHKSSPLFWIQWGTMLIAILFGFKKRRAA